MATHPGEVLAAELEERGIDAHSWMSRCIVTRTLSIIPFFRSNDFHHHLRLFSRT